MSACQSARKGTGSAIACALMAVSAFVFASVDSAASQGAPIEIDARPIPKFSPFSSGSRFGALTFLGGLDLYSADPRFSGLSGITIAPDGRAVRIVSDRAFLFDGVLDYDGEHLSDLEVTRLVDLSRNDLGGYPVLDTEDIAGPATGEDVNLFTVERRRDAAVIALKLPAGGTPGPLAVRKIPVPDAVLALDYNRGIEAIAIGPAGSAHAGKMLIIAERPSGAEYVWTPGWILGDGRFEIRRNGFDITAARFLPDGDLITLERRFTPARGVGVRLRRFSAADLVPGARLDGDVLMEAGMTSQIDNMEGLAVHISGGRPVLTLVSDNNSNFLQRTLILQFALDPFPDGGGATETD